MSRGLFKKEKRLLKAIFFMSLSLAACDPPPPGNDTTIEDISPRGGGIKIDDIWTGSFLKFDLVTFGNLQAAAYYNSARQLVVAVRSIGSDTWAKKVLLSGASVWDSHRSVTLAFDDLGYLHVSGNMHNSPLNYFRSAIPIQDPTDLLASDFSRVTGLGGAASGARPRHLLRQADRRDRGGPAR